MIDHRVAMFWIMDRWLEAFARDMRATEVSPNSAGDTRLALYHTQAPRHDVMSCCPTKLSLMSDLSNDR